LFDQLSKLGMRHYVVWCTDSDVLREWVSSSARVEERSVTVKVEAAVSSATSMRDASQQET
jgi:hypothetical protein